MSNYTSGNLINVSASEVPAGTLAMKVGNDIFLAGGVNVTSTYNVTSVYNITSNFIEQIGDAYVVVDDNGTLKAQKLSFDSAMASDSGEPETLENVMIFNTGHDEPEYEGGNSIDFYKCATRETANPVYNVSGAGDASVNGIYSDKGLTYQGKPVYSMNNGSTTWYLFFVPGEYWCIHTEYEGVFADIDNVVRYLRGQNSITGTYVTATGPGPAPTVTEQAPSSGTAWTGYKAVQNPSTGTWSFESTVTSGLLYTAFIPEVGKIYDDHTTIEVNLYTGA